MGDRRSKICVKKRGEMMLSFKKKNVSSFKTEVQSFLELRQKYTIKVEKSSCGKVEIMKRPVIFGKAQTQAFTTYNSMGENGELWQGLSE